VRYELESLVGRDQYDGEMTCTRQYVIDEVLMLYQSMREFQKAHEKWVI
jgi:hypothetical protein